MGLKKPLTVGPASTRSESLPASAWCAGPTKNAAPFLPDLDRLCAGPDNFAKMRSSRLPCTLHRMAKDGMRKDGQSMPAYKGAAHAPPIAKDPRR